MSTPVIDTSCRRCGAPMKPVPQPSTNGILDRAKFTVTGYLCSCGHWNNLKRRKAKAGVRKEMGEA